jgi:hypothetical protein
MPDKFFRRYKSYPLVSFLYSLTLTSILFSSGLALTVFIVKGIINLQDITDLKHNPLTFLNGEGIIVTYFVIIITIYTFINTKIIKDNFEKEIKTLPELLELILAKIRISNDNVKIWSQYPSKFYYIYDYSIATGHHSEPEKFISYAEALSEFLSSFKIVFQGIVKKYGTSDTEKNRNFYKVLYSLSENEALNKSFEANDEFIDYLNKVISDNSHRTGANDKGIYYERKEIDELIDNESIDENEKKKVRSIFKKRNTSNLAISHRKTKEEFKSYIENDESKFESFVYQVEGLGIVRFIVSNLFLIQFVAAKKDGNQRIPAGYYSEDLSMIERYKNAFEEFRDLTIENNGT